MLHVTLDTQLADLEARMGQLTRWRDETIRQAEAIVRKTNREFDQAAVPLGRQINELRARLQLETKAPARPKRSHKAVILDGLDDQEQAHYLELLAHKKGKK